MPVPGAVFVAAVAAVFLVMWIAAWTVGLWLGATACRARGVTVRRAAAGAAIMLALGLVLVGMVALAGLPLGPAVILIADGVIVVFVSRWVSRASVGRSIAIAIIAFAIAVGGMLAAWPFLRAVVADTYVVRSTSMSPTIDNGDRIIVDRQLAPRRWDLVALHPPAEPSNVYVKRLIGLPGEVVEVVDGEVRINGAVAPKPAQLSWLKYDGMLSVEGRSGNGSTGSPITLAGGEYYVLGDNTEQSLDSRFWRSGSAGHQPSALPGFMIIGTVRAICTPHGRTNIIR